MPTSVELLRIAARTFQTGGDDEDLGIAALIRALHEDLEATSSRADTLQGLLDILCATDDADRAAAAHVLDFVSWEAIGLVLAVNGDPGIAFQDRGCSASRERGDKDANAEQPVHSEEGLAERLLVVIAETVSPKELHLISLENLHQSHNPKTMQMCLTLLRLSTQRMEPPQRIKFLDAATRPALGTVRRIFSSSVAVAKRTGAVAVNGEITDEEYGGSNSEDGDEEDDEFSSRFCIDVNGEDGYARISDAASKAAVQAAEVALDFIGPLLRQAGGERARAQILEASPSSCPFGAKAFPGTTPASTNGMPAATCKRKYEEAAERSLASFLAFALSALAMVSEKSPVVYCGDSGAQDIAVGADASRLYDSDRGPAFALSEAEGRLVELVAGDVAFVDLPFLLLHSYRVAYVERFRRRRRERALAGEVEDFSSTRSACARWRLGELLASSDELQEVNVGVSTLAYLVACNPRLRDRWLPMVWSRQMQQRLFLPHAENLMRSKSKRLAGKGLKLACFVAECLGTCPDSMAASSFSWAPEDEGVGRAFRAGTDVAVSDKTRRVKNGRHADNRIRGRQRQAFDPYQFDLAGFLQVLIDVVVTCPLTRLSARGHAAMEAFLAATDAPSRYRVLRHLVDRCPWPNATGLLLDAFRREIDKAIRSGPSQPPAAVSRTQALSGGMGISTRVGRGQGREDVSFPSLFASAMAGEFVCEQLQRACHFSGPPSSLLVDMDSRTGALALARHAHTLDRTIGGGKLELREPGRLKHNRLLVQDFLDKMRQWTSSDSGNTGPDHFRLFLLEDAAQQCLKEFLLQ